jgi:hypothetical protein
MSPEDEKRVRELIREVLAEDDAPRRFGNRPAGRDTMQILAEHAVGPARGNPHHGGGREGQG